MWYFKGRRKKYKSPYTGKEADEAVRKSQTYPYIKETKTRYNDNVVVENEDPEYPIPYLLFEFSGTLEEFGELSVYVNNEKLTFYPENASFVYFVDEAPIAAVGLEETGAEDNPVFLAATENGTYSVKIEENSETLDEDFEEAVTNIVADITKPLYLHNIRILYGNIAIITNSATPFTNDTFRAWLKDNGVDGSNSLNANGTSLTVKGQDATTLVYAECIGIFTNADGSTINASSKRTEVTLANGEFSATSTTSNLTWTSTALTDDVIRLT